MSGSILGHGLSEYYIIPPRIIRPRMTLKSFIGEIRILNTRSQTTTYTQHGLQL